MESKLNCGERFTGHGAEWRDSNLSPEDARLAELVLGWLADDRARHLALVENPEHLFKLPAFAVA